MCAIESLETKRKVQHTAFLDPAAPAPGRLSSHAQQRPTKPAQPAVPPAAPPAAPAAARRQSSAGLQPPSTLQPLITLQPPSTGHSGAARGGSSGAGSGGRPAAPAVPRPALSEAEVQAIQLLMRLCTHAHATVIGLRSVVAWLYRAEILWRSCGDPCAEIPWRSCRDHAEIMWRSCGGKPARAAPQPRTPLAGEAAVRGSHQEGQRACSGHSKYSHSRCSHSK